MIENSQSNDKCYYNEFYENNKNTEKVALIKEEINYIKGGINKRIYEDNIKINPLMLKAAQIGIGFTTLFG